jgi:quinol monooxygenase YgiN
VAFVEGYKDRKAFLAHHSGPNLTKFIAKYGSLFLNMYGPTSPFVIVQALELAVGFIRPQQVDPNVFQVEARWVMKPGNRKKVAAALVDYVKAVKEIEPGTYMYTVSFADDSPESPAIPPMQLDAVTYNSAWKDHDAFVAHTKEPVYQEFLKTHGDLFVQTIPGSTMHPYMTTSVLKRFAGFLRSEAFVG